MYDAKFLPNRNPVVPLSFLTFPNFCARATRARERERQRESFRIARDTSLTLTIQGRSMILRLPLTRRASRSCTGARAIRFLHGDGKKCTHIYVCSRGMDMTLSLSYSLTDYPHLLMRRFNCDSFFRDQAAYMLVRIHS